MDGISANMRWPPWSNKGIAWDAMFHMPLCFFDFHAAGTEDNMNPFTCFKAALVIFPMVMTPPGPVISPSTWGKHISGWERSVPPSLRAFCPAPGVLQEQSHCRPQTPTESGGETKKTLSAGHMPLQSPLESLQDHQGPLLTQVPAFPPSQQAESRSVHSHIRWATITDQRRHFIGHLSLSLDVT